MVRAAGKLGREHQLEVRAALEEAGDSTSRRALMRNAMTAVRAPCYIRLMPLPCTFRNGRGRSRSDCVAIGIHRTLCMPSIRPNRHPLFSHVGPDLDEWHMLQALAAMPAASAIAADDAGVASSRMSYSRFLVRGTDHAVRPLLRNIARRAAHACGATTMPYHRHAERPFAAQMDSIRNHPTARINQAAHQALSVSIP